MEKIVEQLRISVRDETGKEVREEEGRFYKKDTFEGETQKLGTF